MDEVGVVLKVLLVAQDLQTVQHTVKDVPAGAIRLREQRRIINRNALP